MPDKRRRDYATEYAERNRAARDLGYRSYWQQRQTRRDLTAALASNPRSRPVNVLPWTTADGRRVVLVVTHDRKGRAKVVEVPTKEPRGKGRRSEIDDVMARIADADVEVY